MIGNAHTQSRHVHREAVIYCRCSPRPQDDSASLAKQEGDCRAWCTARGMQVHGVYVDSKKSGRTLDREGLKRAIAHATRDKLAIVAYDLSRLSRSQRDTLQLLDELTQHGAAAVTVSGLAVDTTTPQGRVVISLMAAMNEYFREINAASTKEALEYRKQMGWPVNHARYGFTNKNGLVEPEPEAHRILQWIYWRMSQGYGERSLCCELEARGIRYKSDHRKCSWSWRHCIIQHAMRHAPEKIGPQVIDGHDLHVNAMLAAGVYPWKRHFSRQRPPVLFRREIVRDWRGGWPHKYSVGKEPVLDREGRLTVSVAELAKRQQEAWEATKATSKRRKIVTPASVEGLLGAADYLEPVKGWWTVGELEAASEERAVETPADA